MLRKQAENMSAYRPLCGHCRQPKELIFGAWRCVNSRGCGWYWL